MEVRKEESDKMIRILKDCMESVLPARAPLLVSVKIGERWGSLKKVEE
jgi:DNA polymerase I-like protein with 3'-5' exonuclease and polymerase domains